MAKYVYQTGAGVEGFRIDDVVYFAVDGDFRMNSIENPVYEELKPGTPCEVILENGEKKFCDSGMTARYIPKVRDYFVRQPDGYEYLNPKDVFEGKFERVENSVSYDRVAKLLSDAEITHTKLGDKTTVVQVILPNGFVIVESSSCVDPENYDHEEGKNCCVKRIENKIWELEGYVLQSKLAGKK